MKKKYIWILEITIWLLIGFSIFYFSVYRNKIEENIQNTYYLFFNDVSGLVKGSPVRIMGINIGHVQDVKIFDNKVFVSFIVTKENVEIPNKATATIEFYGLGGSTSLEINPQTAENGSGLITASDTYKVQDFWDGQEIVANVMIDIYGAIGRNIEAGDLINNKHWFKQSMTIENFAKQAGIINSAENVIIYKLSESTIDLTQRNIEKRFEE